MQRVGPYTVRFSRVGTNRVARDPFGKGVPNPDQGVHVVGPCQGGVLVGCGCTGPRACDTSERPCATWGTFLGESKAPPPPHTHTHRISFPEERGLFKTDGVSLVRVLLESQFCAHFLCFRVRFDCDFADWTFSAWSSSRRSGPSVT